MDDYIERVKKAHEDPEFVEHMVNRLRLKNEQQEVRILKYPSLTDEDKDYIQENNCKSCGTQRCGGIYDEEWATGCTVINKYLTK